MARRLRIQGEGMIHHVVARGNQKSDIFRNDRDRRKYLELIQKYKARYEFKLYAYCLMKNHIHLLVEEGPVHLSKFMQGIQQSYTQYVNKKYNTTGHVFEQRYKSKLCSDEAYFEKLIAYIHNNPVEGKLVKFCNEYPWSGHNEIVQKNDEPIIDQQSLYFLIGGEDGVKNYLSIIQNFNGREEESLDNVYFSSEAIEEKLDEEYFQNLEQKKVSIKEIDRVIQSVLKSERKKINNHSYKKILIPIVYQYGNVKRDEIASYLGISGSRVSNINREYEENGYPVELNDIIKKTINEIQTNN